jgi:ADP-heptose:LPS heptosyltransferase
VSAPRSAHALPALATLLGRPSRPTTLDAILASADPARVRRILIVKPHDQLGDFLVAAPALAALRARYPDARLDLVTRAYLAPLATRQASLDRVFVLAGPATAWAAARPRPDLAFVMNSVSRSRTADLVAALSGARAVIGRRMVGAGEPLGDAPGSALEGARVAADAVYDLDLPVSRDAEHQVDRLLDLVLWTGAQAPLPAPQLELTAGDRGDGEAALTRAAGLSRAAGARRVGIHPAAANARKCWPVDSFAEWGRRLTNAAAPTPVRLVVFDTPKEPGPAHALVAALATRGIDAGFVPALPLGTFAGACAGLDLLACNDSGVMHVAAAVGAPVLSFHSLGRPAEWAPRNDAAIALHGEPIAGIEVDAAVAAARRLLEAGAS